MLGPSEAFQSQCFRTATSLSRKVDGTDICVVGRWYRRGFWPVWNRVLFQQAARCCWGLALPLALKIASKCYHCPLRCYCCFLRATYVGFESFDTGRKKKLQSVQLRRQTCACVCNSLWCIYTYKPLPLIYLELYNVRVCFISLQCAFPCSLQSCGNSRNITTCNYDSPICQTFWGVSTMHQCGPQEDREMSQCYCRNGEL